MHTNADKGKASETGATAHQPSMTGGSDAAYEIDDNRAEAARVRKLQKAVDSSPRTAAQLRVLQRTAAPFDPGIAGATVQRTLKGGDKVSLGQLKKTHDFAALSEGETWTILNDWTKTRARSKNPPTIAEAAAFLGVTATEPAPEAIAETSDIKADYAVKKGCALQALIVFKNYDVLGQSSAKDLHDHIWSTELLTPYRNYDVDWEALYAHVGLTLNEEHKGTKAKDLPVGTYICEVKGHMMVVNSRRRDTILIQDDANAIGTLNDKVLKSLKKT